MIFELLIGAIIPVGAGAAFVWATQPMRSGSFAKQLEELESVAKKVEKTPQPSDTGELIIELIRTDDIQIHRIGGPDTFKFTHPTGLVVTRKYHSKANYHTIDMASLDGNILELTKSDKKLILSELKAYETRKRNSEQAELRKQLAQRALDWTRGVRPVLGGPGVPVISTPSDDVKAEVRANTPGKLLYDKQTQSVVKIGSGSSGLFLDSSLEARYSLKQLQQYTDEEIHAIFEEQFNDY